MYKPILFCAVLSMLVCAADAQAQQTPQPVTDSLPITINGLTMSYRIKSAEEKEVGSKGNFSRYSIKFSVTNSTPEAKIILYKEGWNVLGNVSDQLAQFNCLNATGARLTNTNVTINAAACNVLAITEGADGKPEKTKKFVQIGYWIKAGQTISTDAIVIVPLNEKPKVQVMYLANSLQPTASATYEGGQTYPGTNAGTYAINNAGFAKIKNLSGNTYINNQNGPLSCGNIESGWWSAQWQISPVQGTGYYTIKNRWKENYISTESPVNLLSQNNQSTAAMWIAEPINSNVFRFKNAGNGSYLNIAGGNIQSSFISADSPGENWLLEY